MNAPRRPEHPRDIKLPANCEHEHAVLNLTTAQYLKTNLVFKTLTNLNQTESEIAIKIVDENNYEISK